MLESGHLNEFVSRVACCMALQMKGEGPKPPFGPSNTGSLSFDNSKCSRLESGLQ